MELFNGVEGLFEYSGASDELDAPRFWAEFGADMKRDIEL